MSTNSVGPELSLPETLGAWIASQRWFAGKESEPRLERVGGWSVGDDRLRLQNHYVLDHGNELAITYQVPLTDRAEALAGVTPVGVVRDRFVYDAALDPDYARIVMDLISGARTVDGVRGHRWPSATISDVVSAQLLVGEQSNTSIICEMSDGRPVIVKIFRALHHGANPDVTLQSAIAATGSTFVPQPIGSLTGDWDDSTQPAGVAQGHLAFAQEFLPGVQDAWRVALRAAENEDDFSSAARSLGEATAEVHESLASVFPTREPSSDDIEAIVGAMRNRLSEAVRAVPSLEQYRPAIEALFESARRADWPRLQRIHGDFHLGQVLSVPGRGWVLLDFEGEPLRPMADREEPDLPLRDIAGMLRSFDYVAGSVTLARRSESAVDWAVDARLAFVEGYSARSGRDLSGYRVLLDALEIDKALYETVYEARNRPTWVEIPVTAIRRLALGHATETATGRGSEGVRPRSSR